MQKTTRLLFLVGAWLVAGGIIIDSMLNMPKADGFTIGAVILGMIAGIRAVMHEIKARANAKYDMGMRAAIARPKPAATPHPAVSPAKAT